MEWAENNPDQRQNKPSRKAKPESTKSPDLSDFDALDEDKKDKCRDWQRSSSPTTMVSFRSKVEVMFPPDMLFPDDVLL